MDILRCLHIEFKILLVFFSVLLFVTHRQSKFVFVLLQKVFERLHIMYTVGYSISLVSLLVAVSILCYFK